jgi:hypothetical protein
MLDKKKEIEKAWAAVEELFDIQLSWEALFRYYE